MAKAADVFPPLVAERARRVAAPIYVSHLGISIVFGDAVQIVDNGNTVIAFVLGERDDGSVDALRWLAVSELDAVMRVVGFLDGTDFAGSSTVLELVLSPTVFSFKTSVVVAPAWVLPPRRFQSAAVTGLGGTYLGNAWYALGSRALRRLPLDWEERIASVPLESGSAYYAGSVFAQLLLERVKIADAVRERAASTTALHPRDGGDAAVVASHPARHQ